jgi:D-sedoheptulose 7-phosphate isomerase
LSASIEVKRALLEGSLDAVIGVSRVMADSVRSGGKVLLCGNGGSAADCQHLATEFVVRLTARRDRDAIAAIALTTDTSTLTAASNDFGFERVFSRQVEALGKSGDVLMGFSTSGASENIIRAMDTARNLGLVTVGILGSHIKSMQHLLDHVISVPSGDTERIQEAHITIGHILVDLVECDLFGYPS